MCPSMGEVVGLRATPNKGLYYNRMSGISPHNSYMHDICPSTSQNSHIYIRTLHDACLALGGEHKLAHFLGVPVERVAGWLNGRGTPPDSVFLRCLDIVETRRR